MWIFRNLKESLGIVKKPEILAFDLGIDFCFQVWVSGLSLPRSGAYKYSEHSDIECWLNISTRAEEQEGRHIFNFEKNILNILLQTNISNILLQTNISNISIFQISYCRQILREHLSHIWWHCSIVNPQKAPQSSLSLNCFAWTNSIGNKYDGDGDSDAYL